MAKITISRLFETSKLLATDVGQKIQDFVVYMTDFAEQTIRNLKNGLTFKDNFNCQISTYSLSHNVEQTINTSGNSPVGMIPIRVGSSSIGWDSFAWYVSESGDIKIKAGFTGAPVTKTDLTLVILF